MLEEVAANYLQKYLGDYVKGLSKEALKISVWQGNVELTNMQLKPEALNALKLPIKVKAGFLGSVKLKIPWSRLGQEPVIVFLDRIFLLAEPATEVEGGDDGTVQKAKTQQVREAETKYVEAKREESGKKTEATNSSWIESLIGTIIGNLKLSITNIHIRYEDSESNPGQPFAAGITLAKLAAVTVDENGRETFVTGGALDRVQKSGELQRLAFYFDPDTLPWEPNKAWRELLPAEWSEVFEPSIKGVSQTRQKKDLTVPRWEMNHHYLLQPVDGNLRYYKLGNRDKRSPDQPVQKAAISLDDVILNLSETQYRDALKLAENITAFNKRVQYAHHRPTVSIKEDRRAWWHYAFKSVIEQLKRARGLLSWPDMLRVARLRRRYLSAYVSCLQASPNKISCDDNPEIQELDRELESETIIQWRILAHSFVDTARVKEGNSERQSNKSWWWFGWGGDSNSSENAVRGLNDEEWKQLNQVIGYTEGMPSTLVPGQDPPDMLHTVVQVRMHHNATRLLDAEGGCVMELSADGLECSSRIYPEMKIVGVRLGSYKLGSPEGVIAESNVHANALDATFTYKPLKENVDWSLRLTASPCYVTYLKKSVDNVVEFFQSSRAVSRSVALQTAAALQMTLDEVARNAQQQLNEALKDKPRFSLDLNIAAPKVTIPADFYPDGLRQTKLLLDFGHLTLRTDAETESGAETPEELDLYMRFRINLSDVSAFMVDGDFDWEEQDGSKNGQSDRFEGSQMFLPVLEKCGMAVSFQQICVPHQQYPSTRVALRLPSLGFQFSPARYHRLMQVLKIFQSSESEETVDSVRPWEPADFEGDVSVLAWKGVGHREAVWQHRYAALAGPFLYILESTSAKSYQVCYSLIGKQVFPVPPETVGDVQHVVAICDAGQFSSKVVESANALLLRFDEEESLNTWLSRLRSAIFQSSAPTAVANMIQAPGEKAQDPKDALLSAAGGNNQTNPAEQENFFLTGALDELKIVVSNSQGAVYTSKEFLLAEEVPVLILRALGSKVEFAMRQYDMSLGAVLQSLEVEDKLFGSSHPSLRYLARSSIISPKKVMSKKRRGISNGKTGPGLGKKHTREKQPGEDDKFFDAAEELGDSDSDSRGGSFRESFRSSSRFFDADEFGGDVSTDRGDPPSFDRVPELLPDSSNGNGYHVNEESESFVKAQLIFCSPDSPKYRNIDKEVRVSLTTLSFSCTRPTLLAILELVSAITAEIGTNEQSTAQIESTSDAGDLVTTIDPSVIDDKGNAKMDRRDSIVKGLLGRGKDRVVFLLVLRMAHAQIVLNLEDGSQLATLSQEDLHTEVKIFPASYAAKAALGNLRISDDSLSNDHPYAYICDMRNPGGTSFVELSFSSFNSDDDDYQGYEFSLEGKLSEVRLVYLNRFIQELSAYFMGLVPQNAGYVVKLKDRVTDVEKLFTQSEIEGSPALKLDVTLNKPIIIMPRATHSNDFLELDILHINIRNDFDWLGGDKDELGAVRLETMSLQVDDLHLVVGVGGKTGEGIIQEANGLSLLLRRPLRDLWHQVPGLEMTIKMEHLKAALSDKEYQVITECALTNMAETPNLPGPVVEQKTEDEQKGKVKENEPVDEGEHSEELPENGGHNEGGHNEAAWTTIKVAVGIQLVELGLYTRGTRDDALASVQVSGVWAAYKSNSANEASIMATLERFNVKDDREATEPEMRYMIGSANTRDDIAATEHSNNLQVPQDILETQHGPVLTMLVLDAKISDHTKMVALRIQRPRLLVALDFLLALAEFFIPSIHAVRSDGKGSDENPMDMKDGIFLTQSVYKQSSKEVVLSPKKPLVADSHTIDDYVYDGRGGRICLADRDGGNINQHSRQTLIFVGDWKNLRFKNVIIQNGDYLDSCICLGSNSSYSASEHDGVFLEEQAESSADDNSTCSDDNEGSEPGHEIQDSSAVDEIMFDLQAIGPELTFYDSTKHASDQLLPENLLRARMNLFSRFVMKGDDMELNAKISSLTVEASSGVDVLEPFDTSVKYSRVSGKQHIHVGMSEIFMNFSFSVIQLILKLQEDVMSFLRITSEQITVECSEFDRVWANEAVGHGVNQMAFWRPRAPPGFAILGDCFTPRNESPAKGVMALNMGLACVKKPVDFELVWSSKLCFGASSGSDPSEDYSGEECRVWLPVPPPGYVALGCVTSRGHEPPPLNVVQCVLAVLLSPCSMKDCIFVPAQCREKGSMEPELQAFWRVDNSVGSFFTQHSLASTEKNKPFELRQVILDYGCFPGQPNESEPSGQLAAARAGEGEQVLTATPSGRIFDHVARFKLVWWDKGSGSAKNVSIWRPIAPNGSAILGDMAVEGYEPPSLGLVLRESPDSDLLRNPVRFRLQGQIAKKRGLEAVSFWFPVAPPGYVALGCVATRSSTPQLEDTESVRCVRTDLVIGVPLPATSLWDSGALRHVKPEFSIWPLQNEGYTFLVQRGFKYPPKRLALGLVELRQPEAPDNIVVDAEAKHISACFYDDFGGLMAPLLDFSLSAITLSLHGRMEAFSSAANFSLCGTTYNGKYDAWEPLVEQCDGFVRYEYNKDPADSTRPTESRIRLAATSMLNVNMTTANVNLFLEAAASWKKLCSIEESSKKQSFLDQSSSIRETKPALNLEHKKNLVIISHNELGKEIFVRVLEDDLHRKVIPLPPKGEITVKLSPRSMEHRSLKGRPKKPTVLFVALRIGDAELPEDDTFGGREYMSAVRIVPRLQTSDQRQLQYQSARTRSKSPQSTESKQLCGRVLVHWDEVFVFEIEPGELCTAEILVVDLAKGTAVGFCSVPLSAEVKKDQGIVHKFREKDHIDWSTVSLTWHPLHKPQKLEANQQEPEACGKLSLAEYYFIVGDHAEARQVDNGHGPKPGTMQVGPSKEGPWTNVGLNYALGPAPWFVGNDVVASEIVLDSGVKHLFIRSLVVIENDADFSIEISLLPKPVDGKSLSLDYDEDSGQQPADEGVVVEEVFENERYQPISGWGSSWPGHLLPTDPGHWSSRDFANPSEDFPHVALPASWEWTSDWYIDKVDPVDEEGWGYSFDFKNFPWPPFHSVEGALSFVRRRRWVRSRQFVSAGHTGRLPLGIMEPGQKTPLPMVVLRPGVQDYCLQVRPHVEEGSAECVYSWSQVMHHKWRTEEGKHRSTAEDIRVRCLVESEELLSCPIEAGSSAAHGKGAWLCLEVTSTSIGRDPQLDLVKDWRIVISAPVVLVNLLPVPSEYAVAEKSHERGPIVRDRGVIDPGQRARIYHADLRKALYLTLLPQGGWHPKREVVLISHPFRELEKHITLKNSISGRKVKVQIEYDNGIAAKVLRLFAQCWLDRDNCPPLRFRFLEILPPPDHVKDASLLKRPLEACKGVEEGRVVEEIDVEELPNYPVMLSSFDLKTTGLSVALGTSGEFGPVWPLHALADPDGCTEVRAIDINGSYYRFLVSTVLCPLDFAKTKVIRIRPYMTFTNILGQSLHMRIGNGEDFKTLKPSDWKASFPVPDSDEQEKMQIRLEQCEWSHPFLIKKEETLHVPMRSQSGRMINVRAEVRSQEEGSYFFVAFRLGSARGPYRLESRIQSKNIRYRQVRTSDEVETADDGWEIVKPHSTRSFAWENPQGEQILEVCVDGVDISSVQRYDISKVGDHPVLFSESGTSVRICVLVLEHGDLKVVRFYESGVQSKMVLSGRELGIPAIAGGGGDPSLQPGSSDSASSSQLEVVLDIGKFGLSVVDQNPREILFLCLENVTVSYSTGYSDGTSRLKLLLGYLQLDNQLPLTPMPVFLYPERKEQSSEFVLKLTIHKCNDNSEAIEVYPYVGLRVSESPLRISVHEPIIWAIMGMYNTLHLDRLGEPSEVVQADPEIRFEMIDISEIRLKLSVETAPGQRPRGALGIYGPLVTTLGNANKMPIRINSVFREQRYIRKSQVGSAIVDRIRRDLIHQPLQLLSGVDVLGMTSSTLWTLSKGAAVLSNDGSFLKLRAHQERAKNITGVGDGLLQGTEALARGFVYGVSGVMTKPITSAREYGVTGFFQGIGKAVVGFVMQPVSGVLDFVAMTVNGVGASCTRCFEILEHEPSVRRIRIPRAIRGDGVLTEYDEKAALGQAILQLAESGYFRQKVFKEQAKFAWSDVYQEHFDLPRARIAMITNRRVLMLLRPPSHAAGLGKVLSDPCKILWDVPWWDLLSLELPRTEQLPSHVIIHRRYEPKRYAQLIRCYEVDPSSGVPQASLVYHSVEHAWRTYGPDRKKLSSQLGKKYQVRQLTGPGRRLQSAAETRLRMQSSECTPINRNGTMVSAGSDAPQSVDPGFTREVVMFEHIWTSEHEVGVSCSLCCRKANSDRDMCTIWRPMPPKGYVSVGDVAYVGRHRPTVTMAYKNEDNKFVEPLGFDLVWRSWRDGFVEPVSIWMPRAPEGYVAVGCVAVNAYIEPELDVVWCARADIVEDAEFEDRLIWRANQPWRCFIYPVVSDALTYIALREPKTEWTPRPKRVAASFTEI